MTDKPLEVFKTDFLGILAVEVKDLKARLLQLYEEVHHRCIQENNSFKSKEAQRYFYPLFKIKELLSELEEKKQ